MVERVLRGTVIVFVTVGLAAACGELVPVEPEPPTPTGPGAGLDAGAPDVPRIPVEAGPSIPALGCDPTKAFGDVRPLVAVTGRNTTVGAGTAARDALTLLFHTNIADTSDSTLFRIWIGQRVPDAAFVPQRQQRLPQGRVGANDPFLASDGSLFWATKAKKSDRFHIEHASLDIDYEIVTSRSLAIDAAGEDVAQPRTVGASLYYARGDASGPHYGIWQAVLDANDAVLAPRELTELRTGGNDIVWKPVVSADELTMFYALGDDYDDTTIVVSRRGNVAERWGAPAPLTELGSTGPEAPTWLSPDGCQLWFESSRDGSQQLYVATRPK